MSLPRSISILVCTCFLIGISACDRTTTSPAPYVPPPTPPGANVVPLPGGVGTFSWWISANPVTDSQMSVGQKLVIQIICDAPAGYSYYLQSGFSRGPSLPEDSGGWFTVGGGNFGATSRCNGQARGDARDYVVTVNTPDLPFFRFKVYIREGEDLGWLAGATTARLGEPTITTDEYLGWRKPS